MAHKWKAGDKAKVIGGSGGHHNIEVGTVVTITGRHGQGWMTDQGQYVMPAHIQPVSRTISELEAELNELETQAQVIKDRVAWMKKTGSTEFDEEEFRCFQALKVVDSAKSDIEKARALAKLIKG